jgi:hypothetical protein
VKPRSYISHYWIKRRFLLLQELAAILGTDVPALPGVFQPIQHCLHSFWSTAQRRAWCETLSSSFSQICDVGIGTTVVWQMPLRESQ